MTSVCPVSKIPPSLEWMKGDEAARAWLETVPEKLRACINRWTLSLGEPYTGCHVSWTCPATTASGAPVVLKLQCPHDESSHEAEALRQWNGAGAVRLLDFDPEMHALLLERCQPGDHLSSRPGSQALQAILALLPQLWIPAAEPFTSLPDEAAAWHEEIPQAYERTGRPFEVELLQAALGALDELGPSQDEQVLLHQDLHADNVLLSGDDWVAIDPKPLVGERAFGLAPVIRSYELGHSREAVLDRLFTSSRTLELDAERVRKWALAQTVAWAFTETGANPKHIETARWLVSAAS